MKLPPTNGDGRGPAVRQAVEGIVRRVRFPDGTWVAAYRRDTMSEQHTLIHVICDECGEVDVLSILEHPRDSGQVEAVSEAHHTMAEQHADETGHHVEVGETDGSPSDVVELARGMAPSVSGATPEDFAEEAKA